MSEIQTHKFKGLILLETYSPVLEAWRIREARNKSNIQEFTPLPALQRPRAKEIIVSALIRPMRLFAEPIVLATSSLMALVYAIFYLFFEAYPLIFGGKGLDRRCVYLLPKLTLIKASTT